MKKTYQLFALAMATTLTSMGLASCHDDENGAIPEEKKSIAPSGIVLLSVPEEIVSGDTTTIKFRVNPSTVQLTKENFSLDCCSSDVYEVQISEAENIYLGNETSEASDSRVSYIQSSDNLHIVDLYNDSINGQALDGQYVIRVAAQSERNIIDLSKWALVCSYTDGNGETANVSSESFDLKQIPLPKNGVFAWSPQAINLKAGNLKVDKETNTSVLDSAAINGVKWYIKARTYKNPQTGSTTTYDYDKYITKAQPVLLQDTTTITCTDKEPAIAFGMSGVVDHIYVAEPDITVDPIKTLYDGSDKKYETFNNAFAITDKYGHVGVWTQTLNYVIPNTLTYSITLPDPLATGKYSVTDKAAYLLKEYGIDANLISRYPCGKASYLQGVNLHVLPGVYGVMITKAACGFGGDTFSISVNSSDTSLVTPEEFCKRVYFVYILAGAEENSTLFAVAENFTQTK